MLFWGHFLVLDINLKANDGKSDSDSKESGKRQGNRGDENPKSTYIDIGFGDNRKSFAGMHRFEVIRSHHDDGDEEAGGNGNGKEITFCYSSISCNPTVNRILGPRFVFALHRIYGGLLFRNGIKGVSTS